MNVKKVFTILIFFTLVLISLFFKYSFSIEHTQSLIFQSILVPRTIIAILVGGSLAVIGWIFQILFRNSLATPYTMGISSVAAVSLAVSELLLDFSFIEGSMAIVIYSLSIVAIIDLYFLMIRKRYDRNRLLLFGVCVGILSSSAIVFIQSLLGNESVSKLVRWMMGSIDIFGMSEVYLLLISSLVFLLIIFFLRKEITLISIGNDFAATRGVNVQKVFTYTFICSNILIAIIVWVCGPIGFIGLIVPHFTKNFSSKDFQRSWHECFVHGGIFLLFATILSKGLLEYHIIPVGALTALIGAPLLVFQLIKKS